MRRLCLRHDNAKAGNARVSLGTNLLSWSLHSFFRKHPEDVPRTSETVPPTRCCRRLVGKAFLRFLCRQDAGSTLWFMETLRMRTDLHRSRHQSKLND